MLEFGLSQTCRITESIKTICRNCTVPVKNPLEGIPKLRQTEDFLKIHGSHLTPNRDKIDKLRYQ